MSNLYEINKELQLSLSSMVDSDGVIIEGMESKIDSLFEEKELKLLNCAKYIKNELAFIDMLKAEEKALNDRRKQIERRVEWMKQYVLSNMESGEKVKDSQAEISTRKSTSVNIIDASLLPEYCVKIIPETKTPDKNAIKKAFKSGTVEGAEMIDKLNVSIK